MQRVTVSITFSDDWTYSHDLRKIKDAMLLAGVSRSSELGRNIRSFDAKCAVNVRKANPRP